MPPQWLMSGCRISTAPDSRNGRTSQRLCRRSPSAIGVVVNCDSALIASGCSESKGSSMKRGRWASSTFASCFAMGLCTRPWKSMPASIPRALTAFNLSTQSSRADGESSHPRSSVPFILTEVKP